MVDGSIWLFSYSIPRIKGFREHRRGGKRGWTFGLGLVHTLRDPFRDLVDRLFRFDSSTRNICILHMMYL